ncbi:MAG TPA: hypothetical protein O0X23_02770 [Methanocorpusculum sp.]|nr:hypothetical protein [Methanocorpusculum sp.]
MLESLVLRVFWWISDYGSSTRRIIGVFITLNTIFTLIYLYLIPYLPMTTPTGMEPIPLLENTTGLIMGFMQTTPDSFQHHRNCDEKH